MWNSCHHENTSTQEVFVIRHLQSNLLGIPAIKSLHLVPPVYATTVYRNFPQLFEGLGTMAGAYDIQLKADAKPQALFTARHVPIHLHAQVQAKLEWMESLGVISRVDKPTEWCAGMVGMVVEHVPGKLLYTADALSCSPLHVNEDTTMDKYDSVESYAAMVTSTLPASSERLEVYHRAQAADPICQNVIAFCRSKWLNK